MKECPACRRCLPDELEFCPDDGAELDDVFPGPPLLAGRYLLVRRIGRGGAGSVYRARHTGLDRVVAVKILHGRLDPDASERFRREARALGRLHHPGVVAVQDFDVDTGRNLPFLVMELVEGESLRERLRRGPLPTEQALEIAERVARAVRYAHDRGILHRDLKPSNVLLDERDDVESVRVVDFGLATFFEDPEATPPMPGLDDLMGDSASFEAGARPVDGESAALVGTPGYMAPEVLRGEYHSTGSDAWSLAVLTWEMVSGARPFAGSSIWQLYQSIKAGPARSGTAPTGHFERRLRETLADHSVARLQPLDDLVASWRQAHELDVRELRQHHLRRARSLFAAVATLAVLTLTLALRGPLEAVELCLVDWRLGLMGGRAPSAPLTVVALDERSLGPGALTDRASAVGDVAQSLLDAGAEVIAIDLLLPASWGRSPEFVGPILRQPDRFVLAMYSPSPHVVIGPEVADGLLSAGLGPARVRLLFGFVGLTEDADGWIRQAETRARDILGLSTESFAARIARRLGADPTWGDTVWIDTRTDPSAIPWISWKDLEDILAREPEWIRGRAVVLGGGWIGAGDDAMKVGGETLTGPLVQCLVVETLLTATRIRPMSPGIWLPTLLLLALPTLLSPSAPLRLGSAALVSWWFLALGSLVAWDRLMPLAAPSAGLLLAIAGAWAWHRGSRPQDQASMP